MERKRPRVLKSIDKLVFEKREKRVPELEYSTDGLDHVLDRLITPQTILVADAHNYVRVLGRVPTFLVRDQSVQEIKSILDHGGYDRVIAIGGCTALDIGRAVSKNAQLFVVPTVLSTSCISNNRTVVHDADGYRSFETQAPERTIIHMPSLMEPKPEVIKKWSASGYGDLFANISASIDYHARRKGSLQNVQIVDIEREAAVAVHALNHVAQDFVDFDEAALRTLGGFLHETSLEVIDHGGSELSAGSEHALYYQMLLAQQYPKENPTHGELVSIGTLMNVKLFEKATGNPVLFNTLVAAYKKIGLPVSEQELLRIGVDLSHIEQGVAAVAPEKGLLGQLDKEHITSLIYDIYRAQ